MADHDKDRQYASTPMGEMFRVGFKPVAQLFGAVARRAEQAFWDMNDRLNGVKPSKKDNNGPEV